MQNENQKPQSQNDSNHNPSQSDREQANHAPVSDEKPDIEQSPKPNNHHPLLAKTLKTIFWLLIITCYGLVLGYLFRERFIGSPGEFYDAYKLFIYGYRGPLFNLISFSLFISIPFVLIAYLKEKKIYAFAAFFAYISAYFIESLDITKFISGYILISYNEFGGSDALVVAAVAMSYLVTFGVVLSIQNVLESNSTQGKIVYAIVAFAITSVLAGSNVIGSPLYKAQLRHRDTVFIPTDSGIFGNGNNIIYGTTKNQNGTYQNKDKINYTKIFNPYGRNLQENCGTTPFRPSYLPSSTAVKYEYQKTEAGYEYGSAVFTGNVSSKGQKSTEYNEYWYCFVKGFYKYELVRSEANVGPAYLDVYPSEKVINAIFEGAPMVMGCSFGTDYEFYCGSDDIAAAKKIKTDSKNKYVQPFISTGSANPGVGYLRTDAYTSSTDLIVSEWGITISLPEDIADAYYEPSYAGPNSILVIGLTKYNNDECFSGIRELENGKRKIGYGIVHLVRSKVDYTEKEFERTYSESNGNSYKSFSGVELPDGYIYNLGTNANFNNCMNSLNLSENEANSIEDMFNWAGSTIKKL